MDICAVNLGSKPMMRGTGMQRKAGEGNYERSVGLDLEARATEQKIQALHDRLAAKDTTSEQRVVLEDMLKQEENKFENIRNKAAEVNGKKSDPIAINPSFGFAPTNTKNPPFGCDLPQNGGIAGNILKNLPPVGCDLPQNGGISGNVKPPQPFNVCYLA